MKAVILRNDAGLAAQLAGFLTARGVSVLCAASRDRAQAMIRAQVIDLIVMDERIAGRLTHGLALSAERRNPCVNAILLTDRPAAQTDDLFDLIPSLHALLGTDIAGDLPGRIALCALFSHDVAATRAAFLAADDMRDDQGVGTGVRHGWARFAHIRPHPISLDRRADVITSVSAAMQKAALKGGLCS
ncbi:MAG: imidazoleglycerol-phosphate dehydratase [Loktanella sp.]|nr:imidazoleglycerol-phosphate dehydratase [Loktanella sp.]